MLSGLRARVLFVDNDEAFRDLLNLKDGCEIPGLNCACSRTRLRTKQCLSPEIMDKIGGLTGMNLAMWDRAQWHYCLSVLAREIRKPR